jgi:hypothetical protein
VHNYYHSEPLTDLQVMREQANARTKPGNKYGEPTESVIHVHKFVEPCAGHKHEFYAADDEAKQMLEFRFWSADHVITQMENAK